MTATPRIVERDGSVVRIVAGAIEVIAEMTRTGDELVFDRMSIDGGGPGTVGATELRALARAFAKAKG